jgi:predicted N-formylglutamate amidohydrolase
MASTKDSDSGFNLLSHDEPPAVTLHRRDASSGFLFTCDHASKRIPSALGDLGLPASERERHIAWDIGALGVAERLGMHFNATLIAQNYSRLVIDCNRPPHATSSIPRISEETVIPGNEDLSNGEAEARRREIFAPYHEEISTRLDDRSAAEQETILVSLHSFTPVYKREERPWHIGLLYNRDERFAAPLRDLLSAPGDLVIGDNAPYAVSDETDYTIPVHGEARRLHHILLEVRQDLIEDDEGQRRWAERLAEVLMGAGQAVGISAFA